MSDYKTVPLTLTLCNLVSVNLLCPYGQVKSWTEHSVCALTFNLVVKLHCTLNPIFVAEMLEWTELLLLLQNVIRLHQCLSSVFQTGRQITFIIFLLLLFNGDMLTWTEDAHRHGHCNLGSSPFHLSKNWPNTCKCTFLLLPEWKSTYAQLLSTLSSDNEEDTGQKSLSITNDKTYLLADNVNFLVFENINAQVKRFHPLFSLKRHTRGHRHVHL